MKARLVSPYAKFRIYPAKDRYFYFTVYVFANEWDMREFRRIQLPGRTEDRNATDYAAVCVRYIDCKNARAKVPEKRYDRDIGAVLFHRRKTGTGVVSHEMTHAALHALHVTQTKKNPIYNHVLDEALACMVGHLTRQFFVRY